MKIKLIEENNLIKFKYRELPNFFYSKNQLHILRINEKTINSISCHQTNNYIDFLKKYHLMK
jgi:hypothetical protein